MRGQMTEEQKLARAEKRRATVGAKMSERGRRVRVGRWSTYRFDEFNFAVENEQGERTRRYYPDMVTAVQAMFRYIAADGSAQSKTLEEILSAVQHAEAAIIAAVKELGAVWNVRVVCVRNRRSEESRKVDIYSPSGFCVFLWV